MLVFLLALVAAPFAWAQDEAPTAELIARAEAGDGEAMETLALAYMNTDAPAELRRWARAAAEAGRPEGMNLYAAVLRLGGDQPADEAEADRWELRAIEAGSEAAALNRGQRLILSDHSDAAWAEGFGLMQRFRHESAPRLLLEAAQRYEAIPGATRPRVRELMRVAAERGEPEAQWRYAIMQIDGDGGPVNLAQAYVWTRRSAEAGYFNGQISTAVMLAIGQGVAENDAEARFWYQLAAEQGSKHALASLGGMLLRGEGGEADEARGWAYLMLAAEAGETRARTFVDAGRAQIPDDVHRTAQSLRAAWLARYGAPW